MFSEDQLPVSSEKKTNFLKIVSSNEIVFFFVYLLWKKKKILGDGEMII